MATNVDDLLDEMISSLRKKDNTCEDRWIKLDINYAVDQPSNETSPDCTLSENRREIYNDSSRNDFSSECDSESRRRPTFKREVRRPQGLANFPTPNMVAGRSIKANLINQFFR